MESLFFAVVVISHLDGVAFNGNATLAFKVHIVEHLVLKVFSANGVGVFKQSVGQGAFAVVDMSDDAEIANMVH